MDKKQKTKREEKSRKGKLFQVSRQQETSAALRSKLREETSRRKAVDLFPHFFSFPESPVQESSSSLADSSIQESSS